MAFLEPFHSFKALLLLHHFNYGYNFKALLRNFAEITFRQFEFVKRMEQSLNMFHAVTNKLIKRLHILVKNNHFPVKNSTQKCSLMLHYVL